MKIEPMSIDEIKAEVAKIDWRFALELGAHSYQQARRWMTWAHSEARAREAEFWLGYYENAQDNQHRCKLPQLEWESADWLAEVLRKIDWPENQSE